MTDEQVLEIAVGDTITHYCNGLEIEMEVLEVRKTGTCIYERSGAFGHAYALLELRYMNSDLVVVTSIHSDEYTCGQGYATHAGDKRIRGWELN